MSSSARWPSGSTRRWAGSGGRLHRRPEGRAPGPARHRVPGAGVSPGLVLQVARWGRLAAARPAGAAGDADQAVVRRAPRHVRLAADHRRPARGGLAGQREHRRDDHGRAGPGRPREAAAQAHHPARARAGGGHRTWSGAISPPSRLNQKWYGDGTEIVTDEGKLYLDSVLDMGSRRIVGFALGEHHDAELAYARAGDGRRGPRRQRGDRRGHHAHRSGQRVHRRDLPGRLRPDWDPAVDGPGRVGAGQRGDRVAGTPRWSSSCAAWSTSPPRPQARAGSRPGSRSTTTTGATPSIGMRTPIDYELAAPPTDRPDRSRRHDRRRSRHPAWHRPRRRQGQALRVACGQP